MRQMKLPHILQQKTYKLVHLILSELLSVLRFLNNRRNWDYLSFFFFNSFVGTNVLLDKFYIKVTFISSL